MLGFHISFVSYVAARSSYVTYLRSVPRGSVPGQVRGGRGERRRGLQCGRRAERPGGLVDRTGRSRLRVVKKGVVVCGSMDSNTPDFRTSWTWKPVPDLAFELGVFGARTWLDPILMLVFRAGLWVSMAQVF